MNSLATLPPQFSRVTDPVLAAGIDPCDHKSVYCKDCMMIMRQSLVNTHQCIIDSQEFEGVSFKKRINGMYVCPICCRQLYKTQIELHLIEHSQEERDRIIIFQKSCSIHRAPEVGVSVGGQEGIVDFVGSQMVRPGFLMASESAQARSQPSPVQESRPVQSNISAQTSSSLISSSSPQAQSSIVKTQPVSVQPSPIIPKKPISVPLESSSKAPQPSTAPQTVEPRELFKSRIVETYLKKENSQPASQAVLSAQEHPPLQTGVATSYQSSPSSQRPTTVSSANYFQPVYATQPARPAAATSAPTIDAAPLKTNPVPLLTDPVLPALQSVRPTQSAPAASQPIVQRPASVPANQPSTSSPRPFTSDRIPINPNPRNSIPVQEPARPAVQPTYIIPSRSTSAHSAPPSPAVPYSDQPSVSQELSVRYDLSITQNLSIPQKRPRQPSIPDMIRKVRKTEQSLSALNDTHSRCTKLNLKRLFRRWKL